MSSTGQLTQAEISRSFYTNAYVVGNALPIQGLLGNLQSWQISRWRMPNVKRRIVLHSCNDNVAHIHFIAPEPAGSLMTRSCSCSQKFRCNTFFLSSSVYRATTSLLNAFTKQIMAWTISVALVQITFKYHDPEWYLWCLANPQAFQLICIHSTKYDILYFSFRCSDSAKSDNSKALQNHAWASSSVRVDEAGEQWCLNMLHKWDRTDYVHLARDLKDVVLWPRREQCNRSFVFAMKKCFIGIATDQNLLNWYSYNAVIIECTKHMYILSQGKLQ